MKIIITTLILVLISLPVIAAEDETVAECSGANCFVSLFSVESDTRTAPAISMHAPQHPFVLNPETGEITVDGKPIEKLSHEEIRDSLKIIAQEIVRNNESRYLYRQTEYLLMELEGCYLKLEMCKGGLDIGIQGLKDCGTGFKKVQKGLNDMKKVLTKGKKK